jgi:E3 ubiquitin-protein ligase RNF14
MSNLQKQAEEILVLQSIFEERFHALDQSRYELLIDWNCSSEITIRFDTTNATVRHLPPLSLTIQYHDDYPSLSPPAFILSCCFLSKSKLTQLCQLLDNYPFTNGEVCVFEWTDAIKTDLITDISLTQDDYTLPDKADPRAVTSCSSERISRIFHDLIEYDRERDDEEFRHHLQICGHFYCRPCLDSHVRFSLEKGHFGERLCCPQSQCQQALLPTEIKDVIRDPQVYERYERVTLQHGLEAMKDILWCPRYELDR